MSYTYDQTAVDRVVEFSRRYLSHQKGELAGQPLILDDWQVESIIGPLFGCKRPDGTRKHRAASIWISRNNGKSTLAVVLALAMLLIDGEKGAEVYCAAADRDQASIVFDLARDMVLANPKLRKRCKVYKRSIYVPATKSVFKVLSSDAATKHGFNASCVIYDEIHAWPSAELYDVLHTSTGARKQPLEIEISTAGLYEKDSLAFRRYDYAKRVRDGKLDDPATLPVIFEASDDDDFRLPETWAKANPGLGISVRLDYLASEAKRAEVEPSYENTFKRLHCGIWTNSVSRWLSSTDWDKCRCELPDLKGRECYGGLDLSTTTDLSAFVLAFPPAPMSDDLRTYILPFCFIPEGKVTASRDRVPYDLWAKNGLIEVTSGDVVDYEYIRKRINELGELYSIQEIRFDPWNATQLATQLAEGDGFNLVQHRQGFVSMSAPTKELERLVIAGQLGHSGSACFEWQIGNVALRLDPAGNVKPDKAKSRERIDGVVASIMAIAGAMNPVGESVYQSRGVLTVG